jgi:AraC-like DNA-binding protein
LADGEVVELVPGDVIAFPHGDAYVMMGTPDRRASPPVSRAAPARHPETIVIGPEPHTASFVCGFLGCDRTPFNPLLASLPRQLHLRGISTALLGSFTDQVVAESKNGRPGSATVLTRMAELMFIEMLRQYLDQLPSGQTGWLAGLRDDIVGKALSLLHARPGHDWTLADLARETATSRTNLARRFTEMIGQPLMQYLNQWRMQVAANLLRDGKAKVATVGEEVGYDSEAAFSRAFKKATGKSPAAWRKTVAT